ncbi:AsmA family protein [Limisphaera sp. 4302-co]|uniref:DUF748 domain-containing protein n=1 Tax=Limisphaera sp. 4302-co TaxID=3400417 RepID=UPI003C26E01F
MKKKLLWAAVALVVILAAVLVVAGVFLGRMVKGAVETWGPQIAGVSIQLQDVGLSPWSGRGEVRGLVVGNPEGYKTPHAIRVEMARVDLDPASVLRDKVHIRMIEVDSPEITLELGPGGNNLKKILANVEAATGGTDTAGTEPTPSTGERKLQVDKFVLRGARVRVGATALGGTVPVRVPDIVLENLGTGPEGITGAELAQKVLAALVEGTAGAAAEAVTSLGKEATKAAGSVGQEAVEAARKVTRGLGELFKKGE